MHSLLFLAISALMVTNILSFIKIDAIVDTKFATFKDANPFNGEVIKCDLCGDTCFKTCSDIATMEGLETFRRCCVSYFRKRSPVPINLAKLREYHKLLMKSMKQNLSPDLKSIFREQSK